MAISWILSPVCFHLTGSANQDTQADTHEIRNAILHLTVWAQSRASGAAGPLPDCQDLAPPSYSLSPGSKVTRVTNSDTEETRGHGGSRWDFELNKHVKPEIIVSALRSQGNSSSKSKPLDTYIFTHSRRHSWLVCDSDNWKLSVLSCFIISTLNNTTRTSQS